MDIIRTLLEVLVWICGAFLTFAMVYQIVIGFWGFGKAEKESPHPITIVLALKRRYGRLIKRAASGIVVFVEKTIPN